MAAAAEPLPSTAAGADNRKEEEEDAFVAGPAHVHESPSAPTLAGADLPTHQNIAIWGRLGHLTEAQEDALRSLQRIHPDLSDREVGFFVLCK